MAAEELGLDVAVRGFSAFMSDMAKMDNAIGATAKAWEKTGSAAKAATGKFALVGKDIKQLATSAASTARGLQPVGIALSAIGAAGAVAIASVTKEAIAFNGQAALMEIAARSSGTAFDALHDAAIKVGGDTRLVGVSATGAADAITNLYKAGQTTTQVFGDLNGYLEEGTELGGTLRAAIDLAAASELNMAQGADVLAIALATFGRSTDDASAIANNFVQAADASVASVSELSQAFVNVGSTAAAFGWGIEDVNTALALLSQRGIRGAEAGTALKSMMTNLMRPTDKVKEALNELNVSLYDEQGVMMSLPDIMASLGSAMEGLTEEQRNQYVQTLAGTYGMKTMNTLLEEGTDGWQSMEMAIANAATTQEIAARRAETMEGKIEALEGAIETIKITLGEEFLPVLTSLVTGLTKAAEWFSNLPKPVKSATASLLATTTAVSGLVGGLILALPKIAQFASAFSTLTGGMAITALIGDVAAGFSLLSGGASAAAVATTGLAGTLAVALPIVVALGAAVAALYKAYQFHKDIQEKNTEVGNTWTTMLRKQVEEGKNATEIAYEYTKAQWRVNDALRDASPIARLFINEQRLARESTEGLSLALAQSARDYDEYIEASHAAAEAAGFFVDEEGDLVEKVNVAGREVNRLVEENYLLTESQWSATEGTVAMNETMEDAASAIDGWMIGMTRASEATGDLAESINTADVVMSQLKEAMAGEIGEENRAYAEMQGEIRTKIQETRDALAEAEEKYGTNSEEAATLRGKLNDLKGELGELGAAHRETMNQIVFDMMTARLATDGWTEAEAELALEVAKSMGLIDEETWNAANEMNAAMSSFANGEDVASAKAEILAISSNLAGIPRDVHIRITTHHVSVYEDVYKSGGGQSPSGGGMQETYQEGTPFVPRTGPAILHRGEAVLPVPMAQAFRQNVANNNTTNNYNLTTNSITRPGGLSMEFGAMEIASSATR